MTHDDQVKKMFPAAEFSPFGEELTWHTKTHIISFKPSWQSVGGGWSYTDHGQLASGCGHDLKEAVRNYAKNCRFRRQKLEEVVAIYLRLAQEADAALD
jgi:hypothetical protein